MIDHQYDPTVGDGFIRGEWRQVESALLAGLITDEEYERIAVIHDPQCSAHEDGFSWCIHEEAARQAVANAAIEGLTVSAETQKLLAPLAAGEVSIKDVIRDIEVRHGVSTTEQGSGGKTDMRCHYCQERVYFFEDISDPLHYDRSPLCTYGSVIRWMEAVPHERSLR